MPLGNYDDLCNSILLGEMSGRPWNHLCIKDAGHEGKHGCWAGEKCATWTEEEASGKAPPVHRLKPPTRPKSLINPCSIPGCGVEVLVKKAGLCQYHYHYNRRNLRVKS